MNKTSINIFVIIFFLFLSSLEGISQCNHTFNMYDSYGDGWNGASVDVAVNGVTIVAGATVTSLQGSFNSETFTASNGDIISLTNWVSGSWNSEISWNITDGTGAVIASGLYGGNSNSIGNCSSSPPVSCLPNEEEIVITITTDNYPQETYFTLIDQNGGGFNIAAGTLTQANSTYTYNICVPDTNCYTFTIYDTYGDGLCCAYGNGSYSVTYAGNSVASGGIFTYSEATSNIGSCLPTTTFCLPNEVEVFISITTDNFPLETSWQLVDQNGGGWFISPGTLTQANTTYTWTYCVPDTNCYDFTIYDTYGDGLCCLYGNGSYYVNYNGSTLVTGAVFGSSEITPNIGNCIAPSSCPSGEKEIVITVTTDDYPTETSWFLMDQFGGGWTNVPLTANDANTTLVWTLCVPDTNCYTFTILDSYGDGLCCAYGNGSYSIDYDGVQVANGGVFTFSEETCNIGLCTPNCQIAIPLTAVSEGEPCGSDANHGCDDNWKISNFTIQGVTNTWSWGCQWVPPVTILGITTPGFCLPPTEQNPDLFIRMKENNDFYYYSGYYLDTWYPNSFSMYANQPTSSPLEIQTQGLFTSPYVTGQTYSHEFSVYDADDLLFFDDDYIGSYTLPPFTTASTFSVTTSGGASGNAYVDYTTVAPWNIYTPLTNGNIVHGTFWSEDNIRDTDWYELIVTDSSILTVNAISETPFNIMLLDASSGCGTQNIIDSSFAYSCDTVSFSHTLQAGTYWLLTMPTAYSCMPCNDSVDYLMDVSWSDICDLEISSSATTADCMGDNANIDISISGGTSPFTYSWSTGDTLQSLTNITIGTYGVVVTDYRGCTDTLTNISIVSGTPIHNFYSSDYVMGFEPNQDFSGWLIEDANNDGYTWSINQYTGTNNSYGAKYDWNINGTTAADDWLISQCFVFDSGQTYTLSFKYRVASASFPEEMNIYLGDQQQSISLNTMLLQMNNIINIIYDSTAVSFSVPSTGIYYIGWQANSNPNMWRIDLDDINISMNTPNIYGCTDSNALNYNSLANIDDSSCIYCVYGCIDSTAFNYNPLATCDDGSCVPYIYGCTDTAALNYYAGANIDDGSCIYTLFGCTDSLAINYNPGALIDDGSCIYTGCTDSTAFNYNPLATIDDSSCVAVILGCTDSTAINYNPIANVDDSSCAPYIYGCTDTAAINYYAGATIDDSSCIYVIYGCTDSTAFNYNPLATLDDSSCIAVVYGCTDPCNICNYNPLANIDDGSCIYSVSCLGTGCMDSTALNYDSAAVCDDGSCIYNIYGCTDSSAINYNDSATVDDGSCIYNCGQITGIYISNLIHDRVTINWDNMNTSSCQVDQIRIRYREVGSNTWQTKTMGVPVGSGCNTSNVSKTILNLTPSTSYEYEFKLWYCNAATVNWHALDSFTTEDLCNNVTNVIATPLTTSKVEICWDTVSTYAFVRLKYRVDTAGSTYYNIGGAGVLSPLLCKEKNGLVPGENYRLIYRTWCNIAGGAYRSPQWDGPVFFSMPSSIRFANLQQDFFEIYPNPNRGEFSLIINDDIDREINIYIYNVVGELILSRSVLTNDDNVLHFNLSSYPKGVYPVSIKVGDSILHKKVIIQ